MYVSLRTRHLVPTVLLSNRFSGVKTSYTYAPHVSVYSRELFFNMVWYRINGMFLEKIVS